LFREIRNLNNKLFQRYLKSGKGDLVSGVQTEDSQEKKTS
jgi:hypothetical protein